MRATASDVTETWVEIPPGAMRGEGLRPYGAGEIATLFDWVENPQAASRHLMPHRQNFIIDIVEIEANAVHQPSKPGDEIVLVLNGVLQLTTDLDGSVQRFCAGEMVLIPAGWAGIYRVMPGEGPFRELAIVPNDYFAVSCGALRRAALPLRIDRPARPGTRELFRGRYVVQAEFATSAASRRIEVAHEEIICVTSGALGLCSAGRTKNFASGSVLVLPGNFAGDIRCEAGTGLLHIGWCR